MVTVAVVGIGRWGRNLVRCFDEVAEVAYGCHTGTEVNAGWFRENYPSTDLTTDYDSVLHDDSVDAVALATPVETHADLARAALRADKHLFVEKPLARTAEAAGDLVGLADERDRRLFTGYVYLYAPAFVALLERLDGDPPTHVAATWEKFGTFGSPIEESLACHDVAIGHRLFDETFERATVVERAGIRTETDLLTVVLETADGRTMRATYDRTAERSRKAVVVVTERQDRYVVVDDRLLELDGDEHRDVTPTEPAEPLVEECRAFVDWLEGGDEPPTGGRFGADVTAVMERL